MTTRKVHIKGVPFDLDEAPAAAVDAIVTDAKQSSDAVAALTAKLAGLKVGDRALSVEEATKLIADQAAKITTLEAQAMTPEKLSALVADHARTVEAASRIAPKIVIDNKTPGALKREAIAVAIAGDSTAAKDMIKAVLGEQALDKAPDHVVDTLFSALGAIFPRGSSASNAVDVGREIAAGLATHHGNDSAGTDQWERFAAMDRGGNHAGGPQLASLLIGGYELVASKA